MTTEISTQLTGRLRAQLSIALSILTLIAIGCGESDPQKSDQQKELTLVDSIPMVNYDPMLDAKVRSGDTMIADLAAMIPKGIITESDMKNYLGPYVGKHGGIKQTDSTVLAMTYRQLLDQALTIDLSGGIPPCDGCTDSILIFIPGSSVRSYVGKGHRNFQSMIREALKDVDDVSSDYKKTPLNLPVDATSWRETILTSMQGRQDIDWVVFGNTLLLLDRDGKNPSSYSYGQILAAVDKVKSMYGFEDVRRLFEHSRMKSSQS